MSERYILDENNNPVPEPDLLTWAKWCETANRFVARDEIGDVTVSTVFLGLDHSWDGPPPVLWETMIFGGTHDQYQDRWSTHEEALAGHARAVALVKGEPVK